MEVKYQENSNAGVLQNLFISKVYGWMSLALLITGLVSFYVVSTEKLLIFFYQNMTYFYGLLFFELLVVWYLSKNVHKMTISSAALTFIGYSILNGITISYIFLIYTLESIGSTFLITALTFGMMSLYGYKTKKDLTSIGNLAFMALFGLIFASVVNFFFQNETLYWLTTYIGVLVFIGLIAYDTQKLKTLGHYLGGKEVANKESIRGALSLYLDFINLFLLLLRILGRRRR